MVTQGLNPAKKQCSFIPYGNKLTMQREYPGSIALARRYGGMKDIKAGVIYENDVFEYAIDPKTGRKHITRHDQKLANIDEEKIKGAYAVIEFEDGDTDTEIMTIMQIKKSWAQGKAKGEGPAHKNFAGEMAKKTVIGRACKILIASSDDSVLLESESDSRIEKAKAQIESEENKGEVIEIPEEIIDPNITTTSSTVPLTQNPYPHETPPLSILNQETPLDQSEKNLTPPEEPNKTSKNKSNRKADF
jgi:recombination protein RecT